VEAGLLLLDAPEVGGILSVREETEAANNGGNRENREES
jgi:hypothetical protein